MIDRASPRERSARAKSDPRRSRVTRAEADACREDRASRAKGSERSARAPRPVALDRDAALARVLETHRALDRSAALARDPVRFARRYERRDDREIAALVCALLAFGNVTAVGRKLHELLIDRLEDAPARDRSLDELRAALRSFAHRTFRGEDIARLVWAARAMQREHDGLFVPLEASLALGGDLREALASWADELRHRAFGHSMTRGQKHLLPEVRGPSACKRLALLCRWIARPDDGVDLGLASIATSALVIPLDVHVHRVSVALGLTAERSATWRAAVEVTAALAALDPEDPVRFDFALCHTEIANRLKTKA
jgi:uncharacterized protein (TIGR02757 family)